jgi:hypothetical protein
MTGNCRPEAEQPVASAEGEEEATSNPQQGNGGCRPARRFELFGTRGRSSNSTAIDLEKAMEFAQCGSDSGKNFPDPASHRPLVETSRIPSATEWGARSNSGFQAAAQRCSAIDSGELGLRVR